MASDSGRVLLAGAGGQSCSSPSLSFPTCRMAMISPTLNDYCRRVWCISYHQRALATLSTGLSAWTHRPSRTLRAAVFRCSARSMLTSSLARATSCGSAGSPSAPPRPSRASQPCAPGDGSSPAPSCSHTRGVRAQSAGHARAGGPGIWPWSPCESQLAGMGVKWGRIGSAI